ncbi:MAG: T9SS type A sorting domain-containing protein [Bacteroidales bacterium]|nr:T9SS type A sorting domain-containing protein [Bacteroidales bacterium]
MKTKYILNVLLILLTHISFSQGYLWVKHYTGIGQNAPQFVISDNQGNVYIAGNFNGEILQDNITYVSNGLQDIFLSKYNANGNLLWSRQLGGTGVENVYGIALTTDNKSIYVGFTFNGTTNILGIQLTATQNDIAVAKISASGDIEDLLLVAGGNNQQVNGNLAVDKDNNLYVLGLFTNEAIIAGGASYLQTNESSSRQNFLVKFDQWGNYQWVRMFETTSSLTYIRTVSTYQNYVILSGQFSGTLSFTNRTIVSNNSYRDGFIAMLDNNGNDIWVRRVRGSGNDIYIHRHNVDENGNVYLAGYFACPSLIIDSTNTLTSTIQPQNVYPTKNDMLLLKYSFNGTLQWVKTFGSTGEDKLYYVNSANQTFAASGSYGGNMQINGQNITLMGGVDGCLLLGNANSGIINRIFTAKGNLNENSWTGMLTPSARSYYFMGEFTSDTLFFGPYTFKNPRIFYRDAYVAKMGCFEDIIFNASNVKCPGGSDGSITANPTPGNEPYTFLWSNQSTQQTISNLPAGNYTVTVSGSNNCTMVKTYTLTENPPLSASFTKDDPCPGTSNGSATALPSNGKPPYTYQWSNGKNTQTITNLSAGTYYCTIRDACPTTAVITVTLSAPPPFNGITLNRTPSNRCVNTATFTAIPTGGKAPYSYIWRSPTSTGPIVGTTQTITNRPPQTQHYVTVTDACGVTKSASGSVGFQIVTLTPSSGCTQPGQCTGWAQVVPSNEFPPYTYLWAPNAGNQTTQKAINLCYNTNGYSVTVTDVYGCTYSYSGTGTRVLNCSKSAIHNEHPDISINIYPNPANEFLNIEILTDHNLYDKLTFYNMEGKMCFNKTLTNFDVDIKIPIFNLPEGIYLLRLESENEIYSKPIIIKR